MDDEDFDDLAELYGVSAADVEALHDSIGDDAFPDMTQDELRDYIDALYEELVDAGWEIEVSDLYDLYYGYTPGGD